ncbi:MAG: HAD-IC family P-type ATPase [Candidatus Niyogibacteria bacterium]|nr:HAD-IC family P-type ATPase [Candidatus Niyogibacteria bacterium]
MEWYKRTVESALTELKTDADAGLSSQEAEARLSRYGPNVLKQETSFRFFGLLFDQIKSPLVFILIIAGFISIAIHEYTDALVIFIAVFINTVIGIYQEGRAGRAFDKLRSSVKKYAVVLRNGKRMEMNTEQIVPGDIVVLEAGSQVPADVRLIMLKGLEVNEAILTGEWMPQEKNARELVGDNRITEQKNMAFMGTLIEDGFAKGVVVATGQETELGKIAGFLKNEKEELTPFQKGVGRLARIVGIIVVAIVIIIFTLGVFQGDAIAEMFLTAVVIAVAAIPEGLPVAVTIILAISMSRILGKGGLVKKLVKAETLGSTTIILTDKTGTLTKGEMKLRYAISANDLLAGKQEGQDSDVLTVGVATSSAFIEKRDTGSAEWIVRGKPTDKALLYAGMEKNITLDAILEKEERVDFLPFDSERRVAVALHKNREGSHTMYVTGAPEVLIESSFFLGSEAHPLSVYDKHMIQKAYDAFTSEGMRVVAVARKMVSYNEIPRKNRGKLLEKLAFTGLIAFNDPIRLDVGNAIASAKEAGLRAVLVTGDHANTARAVAHETGLSMEEEVITGEMLEKMNDEEVRQAITTHQIFARVLPSQKLRLVRMLHKEKEIVAMTGDGINDAPALTEADIGIAVGSGTDVAKEASDLVLLHDSFGIIVKAIAEGRIVLSNLRKVITYVLATNFSEVILVSAALLMKFPLPVLPVQILWANLIEEGFMNFVFAFEKGDDVLKEKGNQGGSDNIITREMWFIIVGAGIITSLLLVVLLLYLSAKDYPIEEIRTILFAGLSLDALFFVFSIKNLKKPLWKINLVDNTYLLFAFFISAVFLIAALTFPPLEHILQTVTPSLGEFVMLVGIGLFNLLAIEAAKWYYIIRKMKM